MKFFDAARGTWCKGFDDERTGMLTWVMVLTNNRKTLVPQLQVIARRVGGAKNESHQFTKGEISLTAKHFCHLAQGGETTWPVRFPCQSYKPNLFLLQMPL